MRFATLDLQCKNSKFNCSELQLRQKRILTTAKMLARKLLIQAILMCEIIERCDGGLSLLLKIRVLMLLNYAKQKILQKRLFEWKNCLFLQSKFERKISNVKETERRTCKGHP